MAGLMAGKPNNPHVARFTAALQKAFAASGRGQNEVARIIGIDKATMSKLLSGQRGIPAEDKVEALDRELNAGGFLIRMAGYDGTPPSLAEQVDRLVAWHQEELRRELTELYADND